MKRAITWIIISFLLITSIGCGKILRSSIALSVPLSNDGVVRSAKATYTVTYANEDSRIAEEKLQFTLRIVDELGTQVGERRVDSIVVARPFLCHGEVRELVLYSKLYVLTLDSDRLLAKTDHVLSLLCHEFAHLKYWDQSEISCVAEMYYDSMTFAGRDYFKDDYFLGNHGGHPWENANELFASAYMLHSLNKMGIKLLKKIEPPDEASKKFWTWIQTLEPFRIRCIWQPKESFKTASTIGIQF